MRDEHIAAADKHGDEQKRGYASGRERMPQAITLFSHAQFAQYPRPLRKSSARRRPE
jgi:hypothetical protein